MSAPKTPTTRPGLLDVPVPRKTRKSAFLKRLDREQAARRAQDELTREAAKEHSRRVQEAAERAITSRRKPIPANVTRLKP